MSTPSKLLDLKIHKVSQAQYDREKSSPTGLDSTAIYLVPDSGYVTVGQKEGTDSGEYATAEGSNVNASGEASHAEGVATEASGKCAHAEGNTTSAGNFSSHAEGDQTISNGWASHAEGLYTIAYGSRSHAEGEGSQIALSVFGSPISAESVESYWSTNTAFNMAFGSKSHTEGYNTLATGDCSHTEGRYTLASGEAAHTEGDNTTAYGGGSHAEGYNTLAYGSYSHAEGEGTPGNVPNATDLSNGLSALSSAWNSKKYPMAVGSGSHIEGKNCFAGGAQSHAEGLETYSTGNQAHSEGNTTVASGAYSHAEGLRSKAIHEAAHAEGWGAKAGDVIVSTTSTDSRSVGVASHAEGYNTKTLAEYSHAEGYYTVAGKAEFSGSHGSVTFTNTGTAAHAEGSNTVAEGNYSHAEGFKSKATGSGAHAEGGCQVVDVYTTDYIGGEASGGASHAEGIETKASGKAAHSEGTRCIAAGLNSHAEGEGSRLVDYSTFSNVSTIDWVNAWTADSFHAASGRAAHVGGFDCLAAGDNSHAEGEYTCASGAQACAFGHGTKAGYANQFVVGTYNNNDSYDTIFEVGDGEGAKARSNAFEVYAKSNQKHVGARVYGTMTADAFNATSDARLKKNIVDYAPTNSILDLPVKEFDYINSNLHTIGCLAQDLQKICPEIVTEDSNGYLSIAENKLVYLLLLEVKKLKEELQELRGTSSNK